MRFGAPVGGLDLGGPEAPGLSGKKRHWKLHISLSEGGETGGYVSDWKRKFWNSD